jgi:hypothetical protein
MKRYPAKEPVFGIDYQLGIQKEREHLEEAEFIKMRTSKTPKSRKRHCNTLSRSTLYPPSRRPI